MEFSCGQLRVEDLEKFGSFIFDLILEIWI